MLAGMVGQRKGVSNAAPNAVLSKIHPDRRRRMRHPREVRLIRQRRVGVVEKVDLWRAMTAVMAHVSATTGICPNTIGGSATTRAIRCLQEPVISSRS